MIDHIAFPFIMQRKPINHTSSYRFSRYFNWYASRNRNNKSTSNLLDERLASIVHSCVSIIFYKQSRWNRAKSRAKDGCCIFLEEARSIGHSHSHLAYSRLTPGFPKTAIKRKSPYHAIFITSWQPRDHFAAQRDSMIARQKASRAFTPSARKKRSWRYERRRRSKSCAV